MASNTILEINRYKLCQLQTRFSSACAAPKPHAAFPHAMMSGLPPKLVTWAASTAWAAGGQSAPQSATTSQLEILAKELISWSREANSVSMDSSLVL